MKPVVASISVCQFGFLQHLPVLKIKFFSIFHKYRNVPTVIIHTGVTCGCWCSSSSWRDSTSGRCSGNVQSPSLSSSWTRVRSRAARSHPDLERCCCTSFQMFPKFQFFHCRSRNLVISQNRPDPWTREACGPGFRAPGVAGWLCERHGCCPYWHKQLWKHHRSGPWGSLPPCGSWAGASNKYAQYKSPTCHDTYTPDASLKTRSAGRHEESQDLDHLQHERQAGQALTILPASLLCRFVR